MDETHAPQEIEGPKPIEWIIFDAGNVLFVNPDSNTLTRLAEFFGINNAKAQEALNNIWVPLHSGSMPEDQIWANFAVSLNQPTPDMSELSQLLTEHFPTIVIPEMRQLVLKLKQRGYHLAVYSDTTAGDLAFFRAHNTYGDFDTVIASPELGMLKTDPQAFIHTAKILNADPRTCLFIDDKQINIDNATAVGMQVIHFSLRNFPAPPEATMWLQNQLIQQGLL